MATTSSNLLSLLADDIKLSLLERQRSVSIGLEPDAQNGSIARSLESMREGIEGLEAEAARLEERRDGQATSTADEARRLRAQYDSLTSQFHGISSSASAQSEVPTTPSAVRHTATSPPAAAAAAAPLSNKSVRFRDASPDAEEEATRAALFPYRDDPAALEAQQRSAHQAGLDNTQLHAYHDQVMAEQDEQLDRLGESIGRQRELGMLIGDELDEHVAMLDDVDRHVDRQQGRLQGARDRIGKIARRANENKQITTIVILIVILLLLILVLKT